jgi:sigma-B regulation protein RsbU (phosphoserine phosphatase)
MVASRLNHELSARTTLRRFVTFFCAVYDTTTRAMTFTNAGHVPPLLVRADGTLVRLTAGGWCSARSTMCRTRNRP